MNNLNYDGDGRVSVLVDDIVKSEGFRRQLQATRDLHTYGISIERDGKRIDPRDFYRKPPWWQRVWAWLRRERNGKYNVTK